MRYSKKDTVCTVSFLRLMECALRCGIRRIRREVFDLLGEGFKFVYTEETNHVISCCVSGKSYL